MLILQIVHGLNHIPTLLSCVAERAVMRKVENDNLILQ